MSAVTVILFVTIFGYIFARQSCRERRSLHGFALVDHVYKSFTADRLAVCFIACNVQSSCQSLNYDLVDKTCQFNNNTKYHRAKYLVEKPTSVYADNPDSGELPCIPSLVLEVKVDAGVSFFCHDFIVILQNYNVLYRLFSKLFTLTCSFFLNRILAQAKHGPCLFQNQSRWLWQIYSENGWFC